MRPRPSLADLGPRAFEVEIDPASEPQALWRHESGREGTDLDGSTLDAQGERPFPRVVGSRGTQPSLRLHELDGIGAERAALEAQLETAGLRGLPGQSQLGAFGRSAWPWARSRCPRTSPCRGASRRGRSPQAGRARARRGREGRSRSARRGRRSRRAADRWPARAPTRNADRSSRGPDPPDRSCPGRSGRLAALGPREGPDRAGRCPHGGSRTFPRRERGLGPAPPPSGPRARSSGARGPGPRDRRARSSRSRRDLRRRARPRAGRRAAHRHANALVPRRSISRRAGRGAPRPRREGQPSRPSRLRSLPRRPARGRAAIPGLATRRALARPRGCAHSDAPDDRRSARAGRRGRGPFQWASNRLAVAGANPTRPLPSTDPPAIITEAEPRSRLCPVRAAWPASFIRWPPARVSSERQVRSAWGSPRAPEIRPSRRSEPSIRGGVLGPGREPAEVEVRVEGQGQAIRAEEIRPRSLKAHGGFARARAPFLEGEGPTQPKIRRCELDLPGLAPGAPAQRLLDVEGPGRLQSRARRLKGDPAHVRLEPVRGVAHLHRDIPKRDPERQDRRPRSRRSPARAPGGEVEAPVGTQPEVDAHALGRPRTQA